MNCLNPSTQEVLNNSLLCVSTHGKWLFCCCLYWKEHVMLALQSHFANSHNAEISYKRWGVEMLVRANIPKTELVLFQFFLSVSAVGLAAPDGWKRVRSLFLPTPECLRSFATFVQNPGYQREDGVCCNTATHSFLFSYQRLFFLSASWPFWLQLAVLKGKETNMIPALVARSNVSQWPGE